MLSLSSSSQARPVTQEEERAAMLQEGDQGARAPGRGALPSPSPPLPPLSRLRRLATALAVTAVAALLAADQNLMAPNLTAIAADLGLPPGDRDRLLGGVVAALFFAVGAPAAVGVGFAAGRADRVRLMALLVVLGEAPCLATAWVTTYPGLLATRTLTGLAAGGLPPLVYSLVGDLAGPGQRAAAAAGVQLAVSGGASAGQLLAGVVGPAWGWRWPFVVVAVLALVGAGVMVATVADPREGRREEKGCCCRGSAARRRRRVVRTLEEAAGGTATNPSSSPPSSPACPALAADAGPATPRSPALRRRPAAAAAAAAAALASTALATISAATLRAPSAACSILQGLPGCLPWGVMTVFMADYLAVDGGLAVPAASGVLAGWGVGGGVGVVVGGLAGQALHTRGWARRRGMAARGARWPFGPGSMMAAVGAAVALATGPALFLVLGPVAATPFPALLAVAFLGGAAACAAGPAIRATLLNVTTPPHRGVALALQTVTDDLGRGAGPFFVARMAGRWGRTAAFGVAVGAWVPCGVLIAAAGWSLAGDEERAANGEAAAEGGDAASAGVDGVGAGRC